MTGYPDLVRDREIDELICDCLDLLLPTLAAEQGEIVRCVDVGGDLPQDVADNLGLSLSTVTGQLAQGRQTLKERFAEMSRICLQHDVTGRECALTNGTKH